MNWYVHRDGVLWLVPAPDPLTAAERATEAHTKRWPGEVAGEREVSWRLHACTPQDRRDFACVAYTLAADGFDALTVLVCGARIIVDIGTVAEVGVLTLVLDLTAQLVAASKQRPGPLGVPLYASGKRKGQPRFGRQHDAAKRAEVLARLADLERAAAERADLERRLGCALAVLVHPEACRRSTLETLGSAYAWRDAVQRLRDTLPWTEDLADVRNDVHAWRAERAGQIARRIDMLESVRDHGFAVGTRCVVVHSEFYAPGDDDPEGRAEVIAVSVGTYQSGIGRAIEHLRTVRMLDGGREWTLRVSRLFPV